MTDVLERVRRSRGSKQTSRLSEYETVLIGAIAALWALAAGALAVVSVLLVGWLFDDGGVGAADAAQVGLQAFLLAHGGSLDTGWGTVGIVPLGLTALPAWLLVRAGAAVARRRELRTLPGVAEGMAALTIVYAVLVTGLTFLATSSAVSVSPWRAGFGAAVLAAVAGIVGALRVTGLGFLPIAGIPGPRRAVAAAMAAGTLALVAGGAAVLAISLALDTGRYAELSRAVAPTATGAVGLTLLGLLVLPNAVIYAVTVGVGPGFAMGRGTGVGAFGVNLDTVAAFPLLAALPDGATPPYAALLIPVLAGLTIGVVLVRRLDTDDDRGPLAVAGWAAVAGLGVAVLLGVASYLAGGPLGGGMLATVGPSGWVVGVMAAAELCVLAAATAVVLHWRAHRD